jgi:lysophospholipase L1-like esterase
MKSSPRPRDVGITKYDRLMRVHGPDLEGLEWHSPNRAPFRLSGFAWFAQDGVYRRMPVRPSHRLPEAVDALANCTAGGQIAFRTDSGRLAVLVHLAGPATMDHMPATGQCGFDCYLEGRYMATARLRPARRRYAHLLFSLPRGTKREVTLNFPLYQGVRKVFVGLDAGARVLPPPTWEDDRPVVVYGTSITQGGCASRPGMAWTNVLSRRLNRPFVNLGFSGSGRGEPEVARVMAEIPDPALLVLDYEGNAGESVRPTLPPFLRILRAAHPRAPILVISRTRFAREVFHPEKLRQHFARRDFQRDLVRKLRAKGDRRLFFQDGSAILGKEDWEEFAVDGVHPSDLGFLRIANALTPVFRRALGGQR